MIQQDSLSSAIKIIAIGLAWSLPVLLYAQGSFSVLNPSSVDSLEEFLKSLLVIVVNIGLLVLGVMLVWSGYLFVTAQGNEQQLQVAKRNFMWVIIGGAILLGAWGITQAIIAFVALL